MKIGYKATYDYICKDHKFEIGQSYELKKPPILCKYGFHYCVNSKDVLEHYPIRHNFRLLEIEDLGECIHSDDKSVTNKIRIVREISKEEYYSLFNVVNNELTITNKHGSWERRTFDKNNNEIFYQTSFGNSEKREYDERNNQIYFENSNGFWIKYEYDKNNNIIYLYNKCGFWEKYEYDKNNNIIYFENSDGYCLKREYDENNNIIFYEDSEGNWTKRSYDENNNCIKVERNKT